MHSRAQRPASQGTRSQSRGASAGKKNAGPSLSPPPWQPSRQEPRPGNENGASPVLGYLASSSAESRATGKQRLKPQVPRQPLSRGALRREQQSGQQVWQKSAPSLLAPTGASRGRPYETVTEWAKDVRPSTPKLGREDSGHATRRGRASSEQDLLESQPSTENEDELHIENVLRSDVGEVVDFEKLLQADEEPPPEFDARLQHNGHASVDESFASHRLPPLPSPVVTPRAEKSGGQAWAGDQQVSMMTATPNGDRTLSVLESVANVPYDDRAAPCGMTPGFGNQGTQDVGVVHVPVSVRPPPSFGQEASSSAPGNSFFAADAEAGTVSQIAEIVAEAEASIARCMALGGAWMSAGSETEVASTLQQNA